MLIKCRRRGGNKVLLSQILHPIFSLLKIIKHILIIEDHVHIWLLSLQISHKETWQILTWCKWDNRYFGKIQIFLHSENKDRSFSNPTPSQNLWRKCFPLLCWKKIASHSFQTVRYVRCWSLALAPMVHSVVHFIPLHDVIMRAMTFQITGVSTFCSTVCSVEYQRKHRSSASLAFVRGNNQWWPVDSPPTGDRWIPLTKGQ